MVTVPGPARCDDRPRTRVGGRAERERNAGWIRLKNEYEAVEALKGVGLTGYEAKAFIALRRLGTGSARDVARIADVPRPQVYNTAEALEERGLVDIQQSDPITVPASRIEEAKAKLRAQFERTQETAFEYIESMRTEERKGEEREDVWTVTGRETIDFQITYLIDEARTKVLFGIAAAALLQEGTTDALVDAANWDLSVTIISQDGAVADQFADVEGVEDVDPVLEGSEETSGRLLVDDTVLLSVLNDPDRPDVSQETAIWSAETGFTNVLVRLIESYLN